MEDVRITDDELKISPLKAVTPAEAEALAYRLYRMMPNLRITSLLAEVDRWTGFSGAFSVPLMCRARTDRTSRPPAPEKPSERALREIGRIERTLFMLDWFELPTLRRQANVELNKGEARNALARAVCFHRLGRLRDRAVDAQQYRASELAVVTAAIALWNTVHLGRARDDLHLGGEVIADALLADLAPVGWQHINLTGDYLWDSDSGLGPDGFRPLRATATSPRPVLAA